MEVTHIDMDDNEDSEDDSEIEIDEDSDDEEVVLEDETYLQRLKQNDPSLTAISIDYFDADDSYFKSINWKENGCCISDNTHLKELSIHNSHSTHYGFAGKRGAKLPTKEQLQYFFSSIHENRSIEVFEITSVSIDEEFGGWLIKGLSGHHNLKKLDIGSYKSAKLGRIVCSALGKVLKHPQSKLKILHLSNLDDDGCKILSDGLLGNSRMRRLCLDGNQDMTYVGWGALSTVLQSPNCNLIELELYNTGINDDGAELLGSALCGSSLKTLNLSLNQSISARGWQTLLNKLSQTSVEGLAISHTKIDDSGLALLANIITLKSLRLSGNKSINPTGWQSFFNSLAMRGTQLVKLNCSYNRIGIEGTFALASLLTGMSSLKTLELIDVSQKDNDSDSIISQGWVSFFVALQDSNLDLVKLDVRGNSIDNEGLQLLVRLLSGMRSLKHLNLSNNRSVSSAGWQVLTGFFQSFALKELDLNSNNINDDIAIPFARALENNKTLKVLSLYDCHEYDAENDEYNRLITDRTWEAFSSLLCNKTSIMDTYTSNHTLKQVSIYDYTPDETELYIDLNYNKDKAEVARQKILQTHFSDNDTSNMQYLLDMELEMMPSAVSWIGRPTHDDWRGTYMYVSGLSLLYNVTRRMPDLFDSSAQKKSSGTGKLKHVA